MPAAALVALATLVAGFAAAPSATTGGHVAAVPGAWALSALMLAGISWTRRA